MNYPHGITGTDEIVFVAAQIAKWLLMAAAATAVGIRVFEWRQRKRRSD